MPNPPTRTAVALRSAGFAVAVALGGLGVWLIAAGGTDRTVRIGALAGMWGLLIGTFAMFGSRRTHAPLDDDGADRLALRRAELEAEQRTALARAEDAAAQRAYEARLEHMLRHEIQATMAREVANLRAEIASLRTDLLDKVGGQMQLERIETTRLIGSDLEALQREVRQLRNGATLSVVDPAPAIDPAFSLDPAPPRPNGRPAPRIPRHGEPEIVEAATVPDEAEYRGRRRRRDDDDASTDDDKPRRGGRDSPEGAELLARLLSRERTP